jgi:hypothetical protein
MNRWTDMTQLLVAFHNFANVPKTNLSLPAPTPCHHDAFNGGLHHRGTPQETSVRTVGTAAKIQMEHLSSTIEKSYWLRQLVQFLVPF